MAMEGALKELTVPVLKTRIPRSEAINQAGLAYELVFDTAKSAPGVEELLTLASDLGRRAGLAPVRRRAHGS
jgi:chromosome partitioning protein